MGKSNGAAEFFLDDLYTGDSAWMTVMKPDFSGPVPGADGRPFRLLLSAPNSANAMRAQSMRDRRFAQVRQLTGEDPSAEESREIYLRQLAMRVVNWESPPRTRSGEVPEFSPEAAYALLSKSETVLAQVDFFVVRPSNFLLEAPARSSPSADTYSERSDPSPDPAEAH